MLTPFSKQKYNYARISCIERECNPNRIASQTNLQQIIAFGALVDLRIKLLLGAGVTITATIALLTQIGFKPFVNVSRGRTTSRAEMNT